jgi:hypothetical protein
MISSSSHVGKIGVDVEGCWSCGGEFGRCEQFLSGFIFLAKLVGPLFA